MGRRKCNVSIKHPFVAPLRSHRRNDSWFRSLRVETTDADVDLWGWMQKYILLKARDDGTFRVRLLLDLKWSFTTHSLTPLKIIRERFINPCQSLSKKNCNYVRNSRHLVCLPNPLIGPPRWLVSTLAWPQSTLKPNNGKALMRLILTSASSLVGDIRH